MTAGARMPASISLPRMMALHLNDLVSYNEKHNEANGEDNRDGTDDNASWNCGVEGPTDDPDIHRPPRASETKLSRDPAPFSRCADDLRRR